ncbi:DUF1064 domain-containing protein [Nitrosomonas communis]|uniref:DUF1064 domain-containing protein n=1 Tax=Nitrosomonas communis TaxID=44574 RepID=UPI003D2A8C6C
MQNSLFNYGGKGASLRRMQALGRKKQGELNGTELAYQKVLEARMQAGELAWYKFEGIKLRLADKTFYSPDFAVMLANGEMEIHEVKGFMTDDANVKIKIAADMYPFRFFIVRTKLKRDGGGFSIEEV